MPVVEESSRPTGAGDPDQVAVAAMLATTPMCLPTAPHPNGTAAQQDDPDDWSYARLSRAETLWGPHNYHRYPAKFIPQLAARIIREYSQPGNVVADPFCGSGTAGVEGLRAGRRVWLSDINPVAALISQAKIHPLDPAALVASWQTMERRVRGLTRIGRRSLTEQEKTEIAAIRIAQATPDERWRYWFPATHRAVLGELLTLLRDASAGSWRTFYLCAFSNVLRGCSIWLSGSTKPQKDLTRTLADPVEAFMAQVRNMSNRNALYWRDLEAAGYAPADTAEHGIVTVADARALPLLARSVDLLVTSPPYSTCYEYAEIHQLTHLWLERFGLLTGPLQEIIGTKGSSVLVRQNAAQAAQRNIGATAEVGTPENRVPGGEGITGSPHADRALAALTAKAEGPKAHAVMREVRALTYYFLDMARCLQEGARVVAPGGYMVLVVGNSRKRGVTIPTSDALSELAQAAGFNSERRIVRQIPARILTRTRDAASGRFSSTAAHDSEAYPEEDILVFKRHRPLVGPLHAHATDADG